MIYADKAGKRFFLGHLSQTGLNLTVIENF